MRVHKIQIPKIPKEEKRPIILQLLEIQQLNPSLAKPVFAPNKSLILFVLQNRKTPYCLAYAKVFIFAIDDIGIIGEAE
ncbi:MAG: hypothetical protein DRG39_01340 [Deltaproteobacteria bacterium]|nr:MAG: hypothetical protein DRG39_01340 [Deltaproteobacteria bacterium]